MLRQSDPSFCASKPHLTLTHEAPHLGLAENQSPTRATLATGTPERRSTKSKKNRQGRGRRERPGALSSGLTPHHEPPPVQMPRAVGQLWDIMGFLGHQWFLNLFHWAKAPETGTRHSDRLAVQRPTGRRPNSPPVGGASNRELPSDKKKQAHVPAGTAAIGHLS